MREDQKSSYTWSPPTNESNDIPERGLSIVTSVLSSTELERKIFGLLLSIAGQANKQRNRNISWAICKLKLHFNTVILIQMNMYSIFRKI